jgi:hypothetical protein
MIKRRLRRAVAVSMLASLCIVPISGSIATAAPSWIPQCSSPKNPAYATYLRDAVQRAALVSEGAAIGLYDRQTETTCYVLPDHKFNTASVVKVLIATALQWRAQQEGRPLDPETEDRKAREMITSPVDKTSNDAMQALWDQLHTHELHVSGVINQLGLTDTIPKAAPGETKTTVRNQVRLMTFLTSPGEEFLERDRREYVLQLMTEIPLKHRFGVPVNAPAQWYNKIGYLKIGKGIFSYFNYITHSVGAIRGQDNLGRNHDYALALMTSGNNPVRGPVRVSVAATIINEAKRLLPS